MDIAEVTVVVWSVMMDVVRMPWRCWRGSCTLEVSCPTAGLGVTSLALGATSTAGLIPEKESEVGEGPHWCNLRWATWKKHAQPGQ